MEIGYIFTGGRTEMELEMGSNLGSFVRRDGDEEKGCWRWSRAEMGVLD